MEIITKEQNTTVTKAKNGTKAKRPTIKVGACQWVLYNLIKNKPYISRLLHDQIDEDFTQWSRAFVDRKLYDGIKLGFYGATKATAPRRICGQYPKIYSVLPNGPRVVPDMEAIEPEVHYYLKDLKRLAESIAVYKPTFMLSDKERENKNSLKVIAVNEKYLYLLKLYNILEEEVNKNKKRNKDVQRTTKN